MGFSRTRVGLKWDVDAMYSSHQYVLVCLKFGDTNGQFKGEHDDQPSWIWGVHNGNMWMLSKRTYWVSTWMLWLLFDFVQTANHARRIGTSLRGNPIHTDFRIFSGLSYWFNGGFNGFLRTICGSRSPRCCVWWWRWWSPPWASSRNPPYSSGDGGDWKGHGMPWRFWCTRIGGRSNLQVWIWIWSDKSCFITIIPKNCCIQYKSTNP